MSTKKLPAQAEPSDEEEEVASGYVDVQASDNEEDGLDDDEQGSEDEVPVSSAKRGSYCVSNSTFNS